MIKVLFVCVHNSARSQMAAAFLNDLGKEHFIAESAGLEPGTINPLIVKVMAELGYDLSQNTTNSVFDYFKEGRLYSIIVKVCDLENGQRCPVFPLVMNVLDWPFEDPADYTGTAEEQLEKARHLRDKIRENVVDLINNYKPSY
ncbi:arsenate reductase ArsC [Acetobacterium wieringae]|uniref:arsenate reductase ArsC n=1 Tax=Acetobacterium wieringae TaxID=52694 RepID=UPI0026EE1452|nr:arsenate reductase ArsC [Acetobacterium wieringae]